MRSLSKILVFVSLVSGSAMAMENSEIPKVDPGSQSCQEMQQILDANKIIDVRYSLGYARHYYIEDYCSLNTKPLIAYVVTKETSFCYLGYVCIRRT